MAHFLPIYDKTTSVNSYQKQRKDPCFSYGEYLEELTFQSLNLKVLKKQTIGCTNP